MKAIRTAAAFGPLASTMLVRNAAAAEAAETERRQPMVGFQGTRFAGFNASSYDAEARTVEAVLSAGTAVRRRFFTEELVIDAQAIDLSRVASGLVPLLDAHNQWEAGAVLGGVSNVRIENGKLVGVLHFGETERAREVEGMVSRGELRGVSIGYKVTTWEIVRSDDEKHETWRAAAWELLEVSLVPVPADANAGVRSAGGQSAPGATEEEDEMLIRQNAGGAAAPAPAAAAPAAPAAPAAGADSRAEAGGQPAPAAPGPSAPTVTRFAGGDAVAFVDQARSLGGDALVTRANELIQQNDRGEIGVEAARSALLQAAAEAQRAATAPAQGGARTDAGPSNEEASRGAIVTALVARTLGRSLTDQEQGSRDFMHLSLLDLARARANVSATERDPDVILRAAHATSDFPLIMEQAGQRILLERYQAAAPTFTAIARRRNLRDFRPTSLLRVGDFPTLKPYLEDGEIKVGTIGEGKETVQLGSFGRRLILTRQAIVNDDIGAFDEVFGSIGVMIAQFENAYFYSVKNQNGGLGPKLADGKTVFHADHGNLAAAGGSMSVPLISAGRAAIRKQKNLEGQVMNLAPRILLVGPDTETLAEQLTSPLVPQQVGNVNPFSGKLDVVAEGSIGDFSYELYADPAVAPVWVFGSLESAPGPRLMSKESFSVDGMQYRVTYDFYVDAIDYRGAYRNPGAAPA
ncbi:MAG: prohead protease/major capsid protein fusion protein [Allosphingosinicella sp.]|uniref:prohead protease/major capsid protein fusion protein n=1 Tax=Allosphingosinicella sp. TaxID=2823234 RepID=UPI0039590329